MTWHVRVGDGWHNTDDLTLDDIGQVEALAGVGWGALNPFRSAPTAKALMALFLVKAGASDGEAQKQVAALTLKTVKHSFRYIEDDDLPDQWEDGLPVVDPKAEADEASTG